MTNPSRAPSEPAANSRRPMVPFQNRIELLLCIVIVCALGLCWYVARHYKHVLEQTAIASYQETQLQIVRTAARSIAQYVQDHLDPAQAVTDIEQEIFRKFVAPIRLLKSGDAWIYAPDHIVFDLSTDFPKTFRGKSMAEIFALQAHQGAYHYEEMTEAVTHTREGSGWYVWLPEKGREIAAWTPVKFNDKVWTIGLSTPLSEILRATGAEGQAQFVTALMGAVSGIGMGLCLLACWGLVRRRQLDHQLQASHAELRGTVSDLEAEIDKRTQTETALQDSNSRFKTLIEAIPDVIYFKDLEGRNLLVNRAFEEMAGLPQNVILGKKDDDLFPPEMAAVCRQSDGKALGDGQGTRFEESFKRKDGARLYFDTFKVPLWDPSGKPMGLLGVSRDITQLKQAEQERQRLTQQLLQAQKMEAIGMLAGGVAHDLNNVLTGIVSYPQLLLMELAENSPLYQPLLTIQRSGERAADMVQDLLTLARRGVRVAEVINLNTVVADCLQSPEYEKLRANHPSCRDQTDLARDLINVVGSPLHLARMVMNLVSNAVEAMPDGGTVCITTANRHIDQMLRADEDIAQGDYVVLEVSDTGVGISSQDRQRIFEPFYTKKVMGRSGTGLGMAVVWGTVKDHNGYIAVHSDLGQGTTIKVYLPASRSSLAEPEGR